MRFVMQLPLPFGALTRKDDPLTPEDERLHDQHSRDVGVVGNHQDWPVLSLFDGRVLTAGLYQGYGFAVRVEGVCYVSKKAVLKARAPWPVNDPRLNLHGHWDTAPPEFTFAINVRCLYGHANSLLVEQGEEVKLFQPLMGMGNTGQSQGNHLHCKLRLLDLPEPLCFVDPLPLFRWLTLP